MRLPALVLSLSAVAVGGYTAYDYYTPESKRSRALHDVEVLGPEIAPLDCMKGMPEAKSFTVALVLDARPASSLSSDAIKRGAIRSDCIRGAASNGTLRRAIDAWGPAAPSALAGVMEKCPFKKDDYPNPACFALEGLGLAHAQAALERIALDRKQPKDIYLGALYRRMQDPSWKSPAQLAELVAAEPDWEARELVIENLRAKRDQSAAPALRAAYAAEKDETVKGHLRAAFLEAEQPGKCVMEDDGRAAGDVCRYFCRDSNTRPWVRKTKKQICIEAIDPPAPAPGVANAPPAPAPVPNVATASPVAR